MTPNYSLWTALSMLLCSAPHALAQTNPAASNPASAPVSQPSTLPFVDSALRPITQGISVMINGSGSAEARQGWPLIISAVNPTTQPAPAQPHAEMRGSDGKAIALTLKPIPATSGRFVWAVAPAQTQSISAGTYKVVIAFGEGAAAPSASAALTLVAAADAPTPVQQEQAPFVLAAYHLRIGDTAAATKVVDEALKIDPEHVGLLILRGDVLMSSADYVRAASAYSKAMETREILLKDEDDPPVLLMARWRDAMRKADKELLNDDHK